MANRRAESLASRILEGAESLASFVEQLTHDEWLATVSNERRTVAALVHHVAVSYPIEVDLAQALSAGNPVVGVTWDVVDQMNAQHAHEHAGVDRKLTVALLRANARLAAERVSQFSDAQLDAAAKVSLNSDAVLTTQFFIEDHAVRHSVHHLASIRSELQR